MRAALVDELRCVEARPAVLLSSGTDSACVLFALLELGKKPTAYSFFIDGRPSFDSDAAERIAAEFGVPFAPVALVDDPATAAEEMILGLGLRKKTAVECAWPVVRAIDSVAERDVVTGHAGDGHFGLTKRAMMHCTESVASLDAFREKTFSDPDYAQVATLRWYASITGKRFLTPWTSERVSALFRGRSWDELNRPRQKEPARAAFEAEFARSRPRRHSDLHKGDSGIAESFDALLLDQRYNPGGRHRSVVGTFNRIARLGDRGRPAIVGEAPSRSSDPSRPLSGRGFADKIAALLGTTPGRYLRSFERAYLLDEWPGESSGKGSAFPLKEARIAAVALAPNLSGREVIFAGRRVAEAFGFFEEYMVRKALWDFSASTIPHPSGVNRWWNDPGNAESVGMFLRAVMRSTRKG